jgi:hypothetical protein
VKVGFSRAGASHLPLYVGEQRKSSANLESLPVWKPMDTQPLYRGYEPALIPVADHPVEPFRRNRKVTNLNQDLTTTSTFFAHAAKLDLFTQCFEMQGL